MTLFLTKMTPPEIDQELADLSAEQQRAEAHLVSSLDMLHYYVGDTRERAHGRGPWKMTEGEVFDAAEVGAVKPWDQQSFESHAAQVEEQRAYLVRIRLQQDLREGEWLRRGRWSRFFVVPGGHIHESMNCSTCNKEGKPTRFGWLPKLSGLTEKDAVEAHGTILCSVCFPTAPVEWTVGPQKSHCPGSGRSVERNSASTVYRPWALCPECGKAQSLTTRGSRIRKHQPPKGAS
jgi:hypothetical protein